MKWKTKSAHKIAKIFLILIFTVLIIPSITRLFPALVGADNSYVVMGASMEPTYNIGDLTFTKNVAPIEIEVGDIIAVEANSLVYTHRVTQKMESDGVLFELKGDANEYPDPSYVNGSQLLGKTTFFLPMGYLFTQTGYMLFISAPVMIFAGYQAHKIYKYYTRKQKSLKVNKNRKFSLIDTTSILLLLILFAGFTNMITPRFSSVTGGYFTDKETTGNTVIGAGVWMVSSSISCQTSATEINWGERLIISGNLNPTRMTDVTIQFSDDSGFSWNVLTVITSNPDGTFQYEWIPEIGTYQIKTSWPGDAGYFGSASETITITVSELTDE